MTVLMRAPTLDSRLDKECACALGFKGFKLPANASKSGGGGNGGGSGPSSSSSSPPRVSKARKRLVNQLLLCDVLCANVYVLFMIACISSFQLVVRYAAVPLVFMFTAAQTKRMGKYHTYVVFHSLWHLGSAMAIYAVFRRFAPL